MRLPAVLVALVGVVMLGGCSAARSPSESTTASPAPAVDISKLASVESTFGPPFQVKTIGKTAIDPKVLSPIQFQQGLTWTPAECAKYAWTLPSGLKGNISTLSAEGEGNRYIAMAIETSEPVRYDEAVLDKCRHVTFTGADVRGVVDVVDAPRIEGVPTVGKHRELRKGSAVGELFTYVAYLGDYLVVVTADPLLAPNQPAPPVNVQRAQQLLADAVGAVRR